MKKKCLGIIPARYHSTRLPKKMLRTIGDKPLIQHVWERCQKAKRLDEVIIATDHGRGSTPDSWKGHSNVAAQDEQDAEPTPDGLQDSNQIWLAAIGPCIKPAGLVKGHWKQSQIAATALACLQLDPTRLMPEADSAITQILN